MLLGPLLPKHHLSGDSRDVIKMGMGLVGTMTAILLGLFAVDGPPRAGSNNPNDHPSFDRIHDKRSSIDSNFDTPSLRF
jgi:hypothetical protein